MSTSVIVLDPREKALMRMSLTAGFDGIDDVFGIADQGGCESRIGSVKLDSSDDLEGAQIGNGGDAMVVLQGV